MKRLIPLIALSLVLAACSAMGTAPVCDQAEFIEHVIIDVPVQEGVSVMPGTHFTKTWLLTNSGTCDWHAGYALVPSEGERFGAEEVPLPDVAAGETVELGLRLTAPQAPGSYTGGWLLRNPAGELFGVGPEGDTPLEASLQVAELPDGVVYDFASMACLTRWDSARATFLPCDGLDDDSGNFEGYVRVNSDPALEHQTSNNPSVLEMKPDNQTNGFIAGVFPPITLAEGDTFAATVGCMDNNPGCQLVFSVIARLADGSDLPLLEWEERYDELAHPIEVDLSALAGEEVSLVLMLRDNDGRSLEAKGFWQDARIERQP